MAATPGGAAPFVVGSDRGGYLGEKAREVAALVAQSRPVEIRGSVCYSSCTLYLGASDVCVAPDTVFGFHGPSWFGRELSAREFEHWSHIMADHYREPLRGWFMATARYRTSGLMTLRGSDLMRMGYKGCASSTPRASTHDG